MRVAIHVRPGASGTSVGGTHADSLVVAVSERAEGGRATSAALRALAAALEVRPSRVRLVHGPTSRHKVVELDVDEADLAAVAQRLERLRTRES